MFSFISGLGSVKLVAIAAAVALTAGLYLGYTYATGQAAKNQIAGVKKDLKEAAIIATENATIEKKGVEKQAAVRAGFRTLAKEVIKYVDKNPGTAECGLDNDGLRLWIAANQGPKAHPASIDGPGLRDAPVTNQR